MSAKPNLPEIWHLTRGQLTMALVFQHQKLIALEVDSALFPIQAGARFWAKITRHKTTTRSLELDLGQDAGQAYLDLGKREIPAGCQFCEVEWQAPALGQKKQEVKLIGFSGSAPADPKLITQGLSALERAQQAFPSASLDLSPSEAKQESYDIDTQINALLVPQVPLARGASLTISSTEACTVIDVNGDVSPATLNRYAALEAARQCRLRNIGGIILIDLVGNGRTILPDAMQTFKKASGHDPCPVHTFGITKLGFLECTRERKGYPLEMLLKVTKIV